MVRHFSSEVIIKQGTLDGSSDSQFSYTQNFAEIPVGHFWRVWSSILKILVVMKNFVQSQLFVTLKIN